MSERAPVWSWQDAIRQAEVPPGTKLLCLTLSLYMSSVGRGAWPTIETLVSDTGMKRRAIAGHLKRARKAGLLVAMRQRRSDGTLGYYTYRPRFPDGVDLASEPADVGVELSPCAKSAPGRHKGKHQAQNLRRKRTTQDLGTRKVDSTFVGRGYARAQVAPSTVNPLSAWGGDE